MEAHQGRPPPASTDSVTALPRGVSSDTAEDERGQIDGVCHSSGKEDLVIESLLRWRAQCKDCMFCLH